MKILIADPTDEAARKYIAEQHISVTYQPEISAEELLQQIPDYQSVMIRSRTKVTKEVIEAGKSLTIIGRIGSGYDNIDVASAKARGITVVNAPDANSVAVAELTMGLIFSLLRQIPRAINSMKEGKWLKDDLWGNELSGKTVGIVGYGYIGKHVSQYLQAFGAHVQIFSRHYQTITLEELFKTSDIITLHTSLNAETKGMINKELITSMKPIAYLLNVSRGPVIDEEAVFAALSEKKIAGAALDVFEKEPLPADSRWRALENVILTPHIGAASREALAKASMSVAKDIVTALQGGEPRFIV
jgi:D-3-phosphoglycerate dehydrogenase